MNKGGTVPSILEILHINGNENPQINSNDFRINEQLDWRTHEKIRTVMRKRNKKTACPDSPDFKLEMELIPMPKQGPFYFNPRCLSYTEKIAAAIGVTVGVISGASYFYLSQNFSKSTIQHNNFRFRCCQ